MKANTLEITPATVTIQRVTVGGKQMTKSVFNQIQTADFKEYLLLRDKDKSDFILGFVLIADKEYGDRKCMIWSQNGQLRRGDYSWYRERKYSKDGVIPAHWTYIIKDKEWCDRADEMQIYIAI